MIFHKGKGMVRTVHRLMAIVFMNILDQKELEVDHINGVKTDNRLENLELVTRSENMKRYFKLTKSKS
jgi:hypothetical protein